MRFSFLFLVACNQAESLKVYNTDPSINITSHSDGVVLIEGEAYTFVAMAADANDQVDELSVSWYLDSREICPALPIDGNGESSCVGIPSSGEQTVRAVVVDPVGASADDAISFTLEENQPPTVQIESVEEPLFQDQIQLFRAHLEDDRTAQEALTIWWENTDGETLDSQDVIDSQGMVESLLSLSAGEQLLRLYAEDEQGLVGSASIIVAILESNTPPTCSIAFPEMGTQLSDTASVVFSGLVNDGESSAETLAVVIQSDVDGVLYNGFPDSTGAITVDLGMLTTGSHLLTLIGEDPQGLSCTANVSIQIGSPPTIQWITPSGGEVENEGSIVLQTFSSDPEDGLENLAVYIESSLDGWIGSAVSDTSGLSQLSTNLSLGTHVLEATVTDSSGLTTSAVTAITINGLPSAPTVTISPTSPTTTSDLVATASGSIDPEGDIITYAYEWYLSGTTAVVSTSPTLAHNHSQKGDTWVVKVTPNDGLGNGDFIEQSVLIQNTPPIVSSGALAPTNPRVGDTIWAQLVTFDADGDTVAVDYDWQINGVSTTTSTTLNGGFVRGDDIQLKVTPSDSQNVGGIYTLGPVTVQNTAPSQPTIMIDPANPTEGIDDLLCTVDTHAVDNDGDSIQYMFAWTVNGVAFSGTTTTYEVGDTVLGSDTVAGEDWTCTVTPSDGIDSGTSDSSTVTISPPTGCPAGFDLAFDITDDATDQMSGGCSWLWYNLFSLGTQISLEWWGPNGQHYGPSTWDLAADITDIEANYLGCSSSYGSNYNLPSTDGSFYMTLVQYNDLLHLHPYGEQAQFGTSFYYGRISPGYTQDDEIYAVGYSDWQAAWQNRYETGDRFRACYAP